MIVLRQQERIARGAEAPVIAGLPDYPGIPAAMKISPRLATPMCALAEALLVTPFAGSSLTRAERELIATAVSAGNDCFFCMDAHGAFASVLLQEEGKDYEFSEKLVDDLKAGRDEAMTGKMKALVSVALSVRDNPPALRKPQIDRATHAGATDQDIQLSVLIASAFCMYNRIVEGFRAKTPADIAAHYPRAKHIAAFGYCDVRLTETPSHFSK